MYTIPFSVDVCSYKQTINELRSALRFGIDPKLESVEEMLDVLDRPDAQFTSVQIAGTNGKTSTARYTAALLGACGLRCGLYTSPGLVAYTDRVEIAGACVSQEEFALGIAAAQQAGARVNAARKKAGKEPYSITEFDLITTGACVMFARAHCDCVVFECGMGGRWDATSAIQSITTVGITGIGLDHMRILGDTKEAIAAEKAAIIKPGRRCVLGVGTHEVASVCEVISNQCATANVEPVVVYEQSTAAGVSRVQSTAVLHEPALSTCAYMGPHSMSTYTIQHVPHSFSEVLSFDIHTPISTYTQVKAYKPVYQAANIAMAYALAEQFLTHKLPCAQAAQQVLQCRTPGRFDMLCMQPLLLIDACHNPQSVDVFLSSLKHINPACLHDVVLLCAVFADKDVDGIVRRLASRFPHIVCTQTANPRALPADELARRVAAYAGYVPTAYPTVLAAYRALHEQPFVACGTITLAGELSRLVAARANN